MNIFVNEQEGRLRAGWRLLCQIIVMILFVSAGILGITFILPSSLIVTSVIPQFIGIIASIFIAAKYFDHRSLTDYGININSRWWKEFLAGVVIAATAIGVIFIIEWWVGWVRIVGYGWHADTEISWGLGITSFFIAMLMVGFHEELFSRGYQILNLCEGLRYPKIGERGAMVIAVILTSSVFGLLHFFNANASAVSTFNIFLAGVVLAVPYILTGSLALSVGLHFSWNFVMAGVFGFPVSGTEIPTTILQIQQQGTDFWTGGAFGPEAGLLGLLGMAIMLGGSCVYLLLNGYKLTLADKFKAES